MSWVAAAPSELAWHASLARASELRQLPDGTVAVVEPMAAGAEPPLTDDTVGPQPPSADQQAAVTDTGRQLGYDSDGLERGQA